MNRCLKITGFSALLSAAAGLQTEATVPLNDYLALDGYVAATGAIAHESGTGRNDYGLFNSGTGVGATDAVKVGLTGKYESFSAYASVYYTPTRVTGTDAGILDAYATWAADFGTGGKLVISGGKFLSNLGYESFYPINNVHVTAALAQGIPAYHTGLKADFTTALTDTNTLTTGIAVVDSLHPGRGFWQGDGNFSDVGFEVYAKFELNNEIKLFAGVGYDTDNAVNAQFVLDLWAEYAVTKELTLAAEITTAKDLVDLSWLVGANYAVTDNFSVAGRVSGAKFKNNNTVNGRKLYSFTLTPAYTFKTVPLTIRGEAAYVHGSGNFNGYFFGAQALFSF
ncbi:MAG: porin [Puniceicoccales bacterium]|jgi:hypothetical protein|nr:porin [Puniceicoccales bacterium]